MDAITVNPNCMKSMREAARKLQCSLETLVEVVRKAFAPTAVAMEDLANELRKLAIDSKECMDAEQDTSSSHGGEFLGSPVLLLTVRQNRPRQLQSGYG